MKKKLVCVFLLSDEVREGFVLQASSMANGSIAATIRDHDGNDIQRQSPTAPGVGYEHRNSQQYIVI